MVAKNQQVRKGAHTVEMAIILPVLFMMFLGFIEFARMEHMRETSALAAYEGAREGIVPGAKASEVRDAATSIVLTAGMIDSTITVTPTTITDDTPDVTVNVQIPIDNNAYVTPFFFKGRTINSSFTLRREIFN
ncbi:MAG: Flp pilus assembly protein TadG [Pirellulaceae bacterium]|jgi:Flp pilus assembly protein TadG